MQDIPWQAARRQPDDAIAQIVESFMAVEMYLPDYTSKILIRERPVFNDRIFTREVLPPVLKALGISLRELRDARKEAAPSAEIGAQGPSRHRMGQCLDPARKRALTRFGSQAKKEAPFAASGASGHHAGTVPTCLFSAGTTSPANNARLSSQRRQDQRAERFEALAEAEQLPSDLCGIAHDDHFVHEVVEVAVGIAYLRVACPHGDVAPAAGQVEDVLDAIERISML